MAGESGDEALDEDIGEDREVQSTKRKEEAELEEKQDIKRLVLEFNDKEEDSNGLGTQTLNSHWIPSGSGRAASRGSSWEGPDRRTSGSPKNSSHLPAPQLRAMPSRTRAIDYSMIGKEIYLILLLLGGRQIVDSFVIAEEIIHTWMKNGRGCLLAKLDFEMAYDCVDHDFLLRIISLIGFGSRWIEWIRGCISTPLLTLDRARDRGLIKGIGFNNNEVRITHLQFADDTILFIDPYMEYLLNVKRVLRCFELVSGVKINFQKSFLVMVGKKNPNDELWLRAFRSVAETLPIIYLGLLLGGNPKREFFWNPVVQRVKETCSMEERIHV
ncbi:hypothetical protein Ddye_014045 [Dipteronia dyeriana]|uniref:Reverse transcriptase domain-containing protein n=1 Tax=Dipteronia dyeriana TaxID=168575 RepID=A0AAE0CK79_9ROSI|nr:hypothetical protein Ddye_014045 [Dipteronia dyeriana]